MAKSYPVRDIEINGVGLEVYYSLYEEPMTETNPPYTEIELIGMKYDGKDVTDLIFALNVEDEIISRL